MITPSIPFMFFGTDVNGRHVYRVYNDPRKFVALGMTDAEQIEVNRTIESKYVFLDYSKMFILEEESQ